jgi:GNAT superfamily N-acetyltransferase
MGVPPPSPGLGTGDAARGGYRERVIREARPDDVPTILGFIRELAAYERLPEEARATGAQLHDALFGPDHVASAHLAVDDATGEAVGFALWFRNFSTWRGVPGIYLEDLYVRPDQRGSGHGRALLRELAAICVERGYARLEWSVLDWNEPSIGFYRSLGATSQDEWTVFRLDGEALAGAAGERA